MLTWKSVILLFLMLAQFKSFSQSIDLGLLMGGSNYSGDLTYTARDVLRQTKLAIGLHFRYDFSNMISFKLQGMRLAVAADDKISTQDWQQRRNLNFMSTIYNLDLLGQINLMGFFYPDPKRFNVYLTGGLSFFHFNPKGNYLGTWYDLQPLGTEGQGIPGYKAPYNLNSLALTMGLGVRYFLTSNISVGLEYLTRQTKTDYLDDVSGDYVDVDLLTKYNGPIAAALGNKINAPGGSQKANPLDRDWFQTLGIAVNYHFGAEFKGKGIRFTKRGVNCPKF
ncbi:MAG: outer membrane beta-barrel protein [Saprospiraceae bacterium]|nr:outer membrane beta-barrel protein [Candidatus Defluviibacterium haderslevense]